MVVFHVNATAAVMIQMKTHKYTNLIGKRTWGQNCTTAMYIHRLHMLHYFCSLYQRLLCTTHTLHAACWGNECKLGNVNNRIALSHMYKCAPSFNATEILHRNIPDPYDRIVLESFCMRNSAGSAISQPSLLLPPHAISLLEQRAPYH